MPFSVRLLPVAEAVKQFTQHEHQETEAILLPYLTTLRQQGQYINLLRMFYGFYKPLEEVVDQHIGADQLPDWMERRKAASLLQDLSILKANTKHIHFCSHLPAVTNTSEAFGALYVLEGSTLGGKMIARMMQNAPASIPDNALTFFSGYRDQTGSRWKQFLTVLNQQKNVEAINQSALATFIALKSWMQQQLPNE